MVGGDAAEEAEMAAVAMAEAMPEEEEVAEAGVEAEEEVAVEEAVEPHPLIPMTQEGATLQQSGET